MLFRNIQTKFEKEKKNQIKCYLGEIENKTFIFKDY